MIKKTIEDLKKDWYKLGAEKRELMKLFFEKDEKMTEISVEIATLYHLKNIQQEACKRVQDSVNEEQK